MNGMRYEFVIIGSGAGGGTLARELSRRGREVLVIERGRPAGPVGSLKRALGIYDLNRLTQTPVTSKEGVILWRALTAGGSTVVSCGNAVRCLEDELASFGIDIRSELDELTLEVGAAPNTVISAGGEAIRQAAAALGCPMEPMPKLVDLARCNGCGQCALGCPTNAKWTACRAVEDALAAGAQVRYESRVRRVLVSGGRATGVVVDGPGGVQSIYAQTVILAAGGIGTPVILQQSGIPAGERLFMDLFVNTYGVTESLNLRGEPAMSLVGASTHASQGFILSPFANPTRIGRAIELGPAGVLIPPDRTLGIMAKISDESAGRVYPDGSFSKTITARDRVRLAAGSALAADILFEAGAKRGSILVSKVQGAHPGGTAAIGQVVDADLQTAVEGLFVCDASVLPESPGLPPILTIAALAKRLANRLAPQGIEPSRLRCDMPSVSQLQA